MARGSHSHILMTGGKGGEGGKGFLGSEILAKWDFFGSIKISEWGLGDFCNLMALY